MEIKEFNSYEGILAAAKAAGIKAAKLDEAAESSNVPTTGKIDTIQVVESGTMSHIRAKFSDRSVCSHGRLRGQAFFGPIAKAKFNRGKKPETADALFLETSILNPGIPADGARLVELIGKPLKSVVKKVGYVLPFKSDTNGNPIWYKNETEARAALVARDFWEIAFE